MKDKIITNTLKYVAKNIAFIHTALNESVHNNSLSRSQRVLIIALADSFVYLERGAITVDDVKQAVESVIAGTVYLNDYSQKTYYSSKNLINCLSTLTMQLSAMFYQDALETQESQVSIEIVTEVVKRRSEVEKTIKHNIRKKDFPDKVGYIRIIDLLFSEDIYKSAIEEFSTNEAMKAYDNVELSDKPQFTKTQNITRVIVKLLIWFGILFSISLILSLVKMGGILLGAIPTAIFYTISLYLCKKSGDGWDIYYHRKLEKKLKTNDIDSKLTELDNNKEDTTDGSINTRTIEEVTQKKNEEITNTENISSSSYKDRKKEAHTAYREKKKQLKEEHSKPASNKGIKIATIVLSVMLVISLTITTILAVNIANLNTENKKLKANNDSLKQTIVNKDIQLDIRGTKIETLEQKISSYRMKAYLFDNKIAFINAENPYYYHTYDCSAFQYADSYYAHNIEYAKSQGYVAHSCVYSN